MAEVSPLYAGTRRALLDALDALVGQLDALVLIGAQAVFLHTGETDESVATETKDADLAVNPAALSEDPLLEAAMKRAGFHLDLTQPQPGTWISEAGYPVDLLVPHAVSGRTGRTRRRSRIPPHDPMSARPVFGIEGALVDHAPMTIAALTRDDQRSYEISVAGPAALLVAKAHKLAERMGEPPHRRRPRDAHDVFRLLREVEPEVFAAGFAQMRSSELTVEVSAEGLRLFDSLFREADRAGAQQAAETVAPLVEDRRWSQCAAPRSPERSSRRSPERLTRDLFANVSTRSQGAGRPAASAVDQAAGWEPDSPPPAS